MIKYQLKFYFLNWNLGDYVTPELVVLDAVNFSKSGFRISNNSIST